MMTFRTWFLILRENAGLVLCGLLVEIALLATFFQAELAAANAHWVIASATDANGEAVPAQLLLALIPYWFAYRILRDVRRRGDAVIAVTFSLIFAVTLLARVLPLSSDDLFFYAFVGHVRRYFGAHPYAAVASAFPDPAFIGAMGPWLAAARNTYGPLWTGIATAVTAVAGKGLAANAFAFKAVGAGFLFGAAALLTKAGDVTGEGRPARSLATFALFAWNPVMLFEFVQSGHNDAAMLFFLVLAFFFAARRRPWATGAALAASVAVKYVTVLCIPFFASYFLFGADGVRRRRGFHDVAALSTAFVGAIAAFFLPFWRGAATFDGLRFLTGLYSVANLSPVPYVIALVAGRGSFDAAASQSVADGVMAASRVLFLGAFSAAALAAVRRLRLRDVATFSIIVLGAYLTVGSFWIMPWYLSWFVPLFVLLGAAPEALVCSVAIVMSYGYDAGAVLTAAVVAIGAIAGVRRSRARGRLPRVLAPYFDDPSPVRGDGRTTPS